MIANEIHFYFITTTNNNGSDIQRKLKFYLNSYEICNE